MDIPRPAWHLGVGSDSHGAQTGEMLRRIEEVLVAEKPDVMVVYGDTNSTIAGALAAAKLHIPVAHVEAGLRSFNRRMPEEINRILTDQISRVLFCPTATAVENLRREGIPSAPIAADVVLSGDVMCDAARFYADRGGRRPWLEETRPHFRMIEPLGYLDMVAAEAASRLIVTDSGGVQKETFFHRVPCGTLRTETEWVSRNTHCELSQERGRVGRRRLEQGGRAGPQAIQEHGRISCDRLYRRGIRLAFLSSDGV